MSTFPLEMLTRHLGFPSGTRCLRVPSERPTVLHWDNSWDTKRTPGMEPVLSRTAPEWLLPGCRLNPYRREILGVLLFSYIGGFCGLREKQNFIQFLSSESFLWAGRARRFRLKGTRKSVWNVSPGVQGDVGCGLPREG